jgi:hypothetical protein
MPKVIQKSILAIALFYTLCAEGTTGKIFVVHHRPFWTYQSELFEPIRVGNAQLNMRGDDTGQNISHRNGDYCELTAMYWVWKNMPPLDFVGFCHYRRYFYIPNQDERKNINIDQQALFSDKNLVGEFIDEEKIYALMKDYDVILSLPFPLGISVSKQFCFFLARNTLCENMRQILQEPHPDQVHLLDQFSNQMKQFIFSLEQNTLWEIMTQILQERHPDQVQLLDQLFNQTNQMYAGNLFIMRWEIFQEFIEWNFSILFELEDRLKQRGKPMPARGAGYVSERLLNFFIALQTSLRIKEVPFVFIEDCVPTNYP